MVCHDRRRCGIHSCCWCDEVQDRSRSCYQRSQLASCTPQQALVHTAGFGAMFFMTGAGLAFTAGVDKMCSSMETSAAYTAGAGETRSTMETSAAYTASSGAMYSVTGACAAYTAGAGKMYSTVEAGAACTAGSGAMKSKSCVRVCVVCVVCVVLCRAVAITDYAKCVCARAGRGHCRWTCATVAAASKSSM